MHYEVEQKFPLDNPAAIPGKLAELGAKEIGRSEQVDRYFNHPAHDFAQTDEAFRIRTVDGRPLVTYKGPKIDRETKTRREIELALPEGETVAKDFGELFVALGFIPVAEVHKRRQNFELTWQDQKVEVALDDVTELGNFVELEISATGETLDTARQALAALAERLQLPASERRSYLELLLGKPDRVKPPSA